MNRVEQQIYPEQQVANTDSFQISVDDSMTLPELRDMDEKFAVFRTSHVGNHYPANLAWYGLGGRTYTYDRTINGVDNNYHPDMLIKNNAAQRLYGSSDQEVGILTTHARIENILQDSPVEIRLGMLALQLHTESLQSAFPYTIIKTHSDHIRDNQDVIDETITLLHNAGYSDQYRRCVNEFGEVSDIANPEEAIRKQGIYSVNGRDETGVLMSNEHNFIIYGITEALRTGNGTMYHLSGPDMVKYASSLSDRLGQQYTYLREKASFGKDLPEKIDMRIVPTAGARFVVRAALKDQLDALVDTYETHSIEEEIAQEQARAVFTDPDLSEEEKKLYAKRSREEKQVRILEFDSLIQANADIFTGIQNANFVSHYDHLKEDGVYVHPVIYEKPLSKLNAMYDTLAKRAKKLLKNRE
ncbi:hypothetical protein DYH10_02740 [Candidatus Saccharibacteria bacterium CPR2]|nr:hypothetical protein [Candidatus Saccharibacteria bacterium CPR2]